MVASVPMRSALVLFLGLMLISILPAHEPVRVEEVRFTSPGAELSGTLLVPAGRGRVACVVIVGGSMSHTRDGGMVRQGVPKRDALKRLADELAARGYASLRYDRPGFGLSKTKAGWTGTYADETAVAESAIRFARGRKDIGNVIVVGESAGAYLACLAARNGVTAHAYIFLGALCGSGESLYEYTFGELVKYADSKPQRLEWATKHVGQQLALGRSYQAMFAAAREGKNSFDLVDGDYRDKIGGLERRREEIHLPPDCMFKFIQAPVLALAGGMDLNVPPMHAARAAAIMRQAGNPDVSSLVIPGADHSFQIVPTDHDLRYRERYLFTSFNRPYESRVYREIVAWLKQKVPARLDDEPPKKLGINERAKEKPEVDPRTENTPERLQLAPGIEIINDITDAKKTAGVETLEGRIGPLLLAEGSQAHFIDMPPGMFVAEHPHSKESIIYTVRGKWVLCSKGRRHVMQPGSLFRFGSKISTGYEVPFAEPAYILIFKGARLTKQEQDFMDYLKGFAKRLLKEQKEGIPYLLKDLPMDHPARVFARKVNPHFEANLKK